MYEVVTNKIKKFSEWKLNIVVEKCLDSCSWWYAPVIRQSCSRWKTGEGLGSEENTSIALKDQTTFKEL